MLSEMSPKITKRELRLKDLIYYTPMNAPIILIYNFSKEQCMLPEDDLRIKTCRSLLNILV